MSLDKLQRIVRSDPANKRAQLALVLARSRIEGSDVYLEPLRNRDLWIAAPYSVQDLAIKEVQKRLSTDFEWVETKVWECTNKPLVACPKCDGDGSIEECLLPDHYLYRPTEVVACPRCCGKGVVIKETVIAHRLATFRHKGTGIEMNLLPGVEEFMSPFLMARWPVTIYQWNHSSESGPDEYRRSGHGDLPLTGYDLGPCNEWAKRHGLRLPSDFEWLFACRAWASTNFYWGDEIDDSYCWHQENSGNPVDPDCPECEGHGMLWPSAEAVEGLSVSDEPRICSSCNGPPCINSPRVHDEQDRWNSFGLVDMVGNVWEYVGIHRMMGCCFVNTRQGMLSYSTPRSASFYRPSTSGFRVCSSIPGLRSKK